MIVTEELKMKPSESLWEYQIRISSLKKQERLTWQEVADIINGETGNTFGEAKYRKDYASYAETCGITEETTERYICTSSDEAKKEQYKVATERLPYLRLMRQDARFETFYKYIADNINKYEPPSVTYTPTAKQTSEYVVTIADLHIGAKFDAVNNSYSIKEAERRFGVALAELTKFVKCHNIAKLHILSLGDIVQGMLRISDMKVNEADVVDAFVIACRLMTKFLNDLSAVCEIEFHQVCFSNHDQPRYLGTKASELATEDMGKIFFHYLEDVLADNKRVHISGDTERDFINFKIFDFQCTAMHGHQVSNIDTVVKDVSARNRTFYDYVFLGHSHSAKEFISSEGEHHNIEVLVAPSFCGSDVYADKLMKGSKAGIKIFEFDSHYGHIASYNIILN